MALSFLRGTANEEINIPYILLSVVTVESVGALLKRKKSQLENSRMIANVYSILVLYTAHHHPGNCVCGRVIISLVFWFVKTSFQKSMYHCCFVQHCHPIVKKSNCIFLVFLNIHVSTLSYTHKHAVQVGIVVHTGKMSASNKCWEKNNIFSFFPKKC